MPVRLVAEEEVGPEAEALIQREHPADQPRELPQPPQPHPQPNPPHRAVMELMAIIARVMGFRLQLFAAFASAAALSGYAAYVGSETTLMAAGLFDVLVFLPMLYVAYKRG